VEPAACHLFSLLFSLHALHALARVVGAARIVRYTSCSALNIEEAVRLQVEIEYLLQIIFLYIRWAGDIPDAFASPVQPV
jgi:hypothetical protein